MSKVEITPELLADLKAKAQKATPGPWAFWLLEGPLLGGNYQVRSPADPDEDFVCRHVESAANAKYIAAASPDAVLALVERIEKQEKEADWLARKLFDFCRSNGCGNACAGKRSCPLLRWKRCPVDGWANSWREAARKAVEGQS